MEGIATRESAAAAEAPKLNTFIILLATLTTLVPYAYSVWAITGSGKDIIAKGFVLLLAGIPVYVLMKWWQAKQAEKQASELVAAPTPTLSTGREGAVVAMKETR